MAEYKFMQQMDKEQETQETENTPQGWSKFVLFFYLYFCQGIVLAISGTMPYIYPELPSYNTLAIFQAITIPFSLKFLLAPFLEKYTFVAYGKRKTSIVIGELCCGVILTVSSFFTALEEAKIMAIYLVCAVSFIVMQDISLDSVVIKELKSSQRASILQSLAQSFGALVGSLGLLKLTSLQFAGFIGLSEPIAYPKTVIFCMGLCVAFPAILMHFFFKQTALRSEIQGMGSSFCNIVSQNKVFVDPSTTFFRTSVIFLIWNQGFNFFNAGYEYELVKSGLARNTLNTINNINAIPLLVITFGSARLTMILGVTKSMVVAISAYALVQGMIVWVFPVDPLAIALASLTIDSLGTWLFVTTAIIVNNFPIHSLSGMFITMLNSMANLGRLVSLHTIAISHFGFSHCVYFGLALQIIIAGIVPTALAWADRGLNDFREDGQSSQKQENLDQMQQIDH